MSHACPNTPPCDCSTHRAQLAAFDAWQEEMNDLTSAPPSM